MGEKFDRDRDNLTEAAIAALYDREMAEHEAIAIETRRKLGRQFAAAAQILARTVSDGGKLLLFGNGGSAADAQHLAAEMVVRYKMNRPAVAAIALTTDSSILTACGNDFGFETLFERQIEALGRPGDAVVAMSTSGRSENVIRGIGRARDLGLHTVGLTGGDAGAFPSICEVSIVVPSSVTARIQEMHIVIGHMLCVAVERSLGIG